MLSKTVLRHLRDRLLSCVPNRFNRLPPSLGLAFLKPRPFHTSALCWKAGHYKITAKRDRPLTYEQAHPPYRVGITKGWNSVNATTLRNPGSQRRPGDVAIEDMFIRKFIKGTWPKIWLSEVIIKRQHNNVTIAGLVCPLPSVRATYFLTGYAEELLSHILQCNVKIEIQCVKSKRDMVFKYI